MISRRCTALSSVILEGRANTALLMAQRRMVSLSSTIRRPNGNGNGLTPSTIKERSPSFKVSRVSYKNGRVETVNLDTSEIMKTASVYARDLFFTLNLTSRQERQQRGCMAAAVRRTVSAILPRKNSIVLSFGNVRAVAGLDHVFLFDAHNPAVRAFAQELSEAFRFDCELQQQQPQYEGEPKELVFLEKVLRDTVESFNRRLRLFEPIVDSFLDKVDNSSDVTSPDAGVHQLVPLKDALQSFEIQVKQSQECLEDLLNHDDEMLALLLTEQNAADQTGGSVEFARHEHVELLLGVYARQISNINMEISFLLQRLQSKQEFVALALSGYRNRMVRMNVHLGIVGLSIAFSTAAAGFFGMNLVSGLEQSATAFGTVVLCSSMGSLLISLGCFNFLSGHRARVRAAKRLEEIETLTNALSDMCALDHTFKVMAERGQSIDKDRFRIMLKNARQTKQASANEVDLLFSVFDKVRESSESVCAVACVVPRGTAVRVRSIVSSPLPFTALSLSLSLSLSPSIFLYSINTDQRRQTYAGRISWSRCRKS